MRMHSKAALAAAFALTIAIPGTALATNGYFLIGYGAKSRAMGGVGVALGQDGMAAAANPATIIEVGSEMDVAGSFFYPRRAAYQNSSLFPTDKVSDQNQFLIPAMGGVYQFTPRIAIGMAVVGAGLGTRYDQHVSPGKPGTLFNMNSAEGGKSSPTAGVSLMQMQMLPTVAYRINQHNTVGMSLALAIQQFRAFGLQSFGNLGYVGNPKAGDTAYKLSNQGNDWSYGAGFRVGWLGQYFNNRLALGVNYSSQVYMTRFRKYTNLFAQHGSFDIPQNFAVGIAVKPIKRLTAAVDVERIFWSEIKSIGNPGPTDSSSSFYPAGCTSTAVCGLGEDQGLGFGWRDQTVYKFGLAYKVDDRWTVRAGYNYGKSPIPSSQVLFNMLAPATVEKHLTLGFTYNQSPNIQWSMSFMKAFKHTIRGKTPFYPVGVTSPVENAAISMYQYSLGAEFSYKM